MNPRLLRSFLVLAQELSFSRAAERLHIAQPALSQQIQTLETQLSALLIDRSTRPIRLTEAGAFLVPEARQLLAAWDSTAKATWEVATGSRGWLSIGFTRSSMYSVLPSVLRRFHEQHPRVDLELHEMVTEEQVDALRLGRIHVGIGRQPGLVPGCDSRTLLQERIMAVLPPHHPAAAKEEVLVDDLVDDAVILFPKDPSALFARFVESVYRDAGVVPRVEHRTFEIQTAIGLVVAGLGVTFVGESVARMGRTDVTYRPLGAAGGPPMSSLEAIWSASADSPHLLAFLDCLPES